MNDLQKKSLLGTPATSCSVNGSSSINNNNSSNCCFSSAAATAGAFGSPLSSSPFPWGTWEDLLLASAVLKHGTGNWTTVSGELQARALFVSPSLFSAEACKCRFWTLNGRFSGCGNANSRDGKIPWFEEVRKLRVAQLKRELEHYDGSIGLLQTKLKRLRAESAGFRNSTAKNLPEQDHPPKQSSIGPAEVARPLEVCPAGDRVATEQLPGIPCGISLSPESVKTCCDTASTVQDTNLASNLQELSTLEYGNGNVSSDSAVVQSPEDFLDEQPTGTEGCPGSDRGDQLTAIGTGQEMPRAQVCWGCDLEKKPVSKNMANDGLLCGAGIETCKPVDIVMESVANQVSAIVAVQEKLEAKACQSSMLEIKTGISRSRELQDEAPVKDSGLLYRAVMALGKPVDIQVENVEANHCQVLGMELAPLHVGSVPKEEKTFGTQDNAIHLDGYGSTPLPGANAMELLRIAYEDGTPVSTPEAGDTQDVEAEEIVELGPVFSAVDLERATHKKDLIGSNVSGSGPNLADLELPEQNKNLASEPGGNQDQSLEEMAGVDLLESLGGKSEVFNISPNGPALELEHLSEYLAGHVENMGEASVVVSLGGNHKCEDQNLEEKVNMVLLEHMAKEPYLIPTGSAPKLELESESRAGPSKEEKAASLVRPLDGSDKHEDQSLGEMAGTNLLECLENSAGVSNASLNGGHVPKLEVASEDLAGLVEEKGEASLGKFLGENLECEDQRLEEMAGTGPPAWAKELNISPNGPTSKLDLATEHPASPVEDMDEVSQVVSSESSRLVELKRRPAGLFSAKNSDSQMTGFALVEQVESKESVPKQCVQGTLDEADDEMQKANSCDSDGRSSIMEVVYGSISKQQESKELIGKEGVSDNLGEADTQRHRASSFNVDGRSSTLEVENKNVNKQPKPEEGIVHTTGGKSPLNAERASLSVETELKAEKGVLEEDGLLVDLMNLKGTDLMNLRKRKIPLRSGNSAEASRDHGLPKERLDETVAHKQPKLSRSSKEDASKTPIDVALSKEGGKAKILKIRFRTLEGFAENADQAALSSNASNTELHDSSGGKGSSVEVFSTRRSRLKLRKLESSSEDPGKPKKLKDGGASPGALQGSVGKVEEVVSELRDEEASQLENTRAVSPDCKPLIRKEMITENKLLPDLLTLLDCLRVISAHRFAPLFKFRPEIQANAGYRSLVKRHMDLNTVRSKLEEGKYSESWEFFCDMLLIFSNALVFYSKESQEYGAARVLRECLIKEMERLIKIEAPHSSATAVQAAKCNELRALRDVVNESTSVTTSEGKRHGSLRSSSCDRACCEADLDGEVGTKELDLVPEVVVRDYGLEKSPPVKELDRDEEQGVKDTGKILRRGKSRVKMHHIEDHNPDKPSGPKESLLREKHSRSSEDVNAKLFLKKEPLATSQVVKRPLQSSLRSSKNHAYKKEPADNSRSTKYSSGRRAAVLLGETKKSFGGGRSSRSAQISKKTVTKGNQASSQPQKRART